MVPKRFVDFLDYRNPREKLMGLMGHSGGEEADHRRRGAPPCPNLNWTRGGARPPSFLLPLPPFPLPPICWKERGVESY